MTEKRKPVKKPKIEKLELNKETIQDLTDAEAAAAQGGLLKGLETDAPSACSCPTMCGAKSCVVCAVR